MRFISTRGQTEPHTFSEAVAAGLAPDGGLFLPEYLPDITPRLRGWAPLSYADLCTEFLGLFATDLPEEALRRAVRRAYAAFTHPEIAPLQRLGERLYLLELFHGPTLAFKDFALQLLGNLYGLIDGPAGGGRNVLGATSGDTGAAAIHGLLGQPRTAIFVLYPEGRVSPLQERQMACTGAANVFALAVDGSFDDAQRVLKEAFGDREFATRHRLAAVNSINLARVLAQCVYYLHAWLRLGAAERENLEFVVPTGNFGNLLAGWMLARMGVPVLGFRAATNQNDLLYRFFTTGEYTVGTVRPSLAPSMDIQVASNFERFLYYAFDQEPGRVRTAMAQLGAGGRQQFDGIDRSSFAASRADDADILRLIAEVRERHDVIVDPHTACAFQALSPERVSVVLATAHPAKFPEVLARAIGREPTHPSLEVLKGRPIVKHRLPAQLGPIQDFIRRHGV